MAKCELTGKKRQIGNSVSHANNKTKRPFGANLQKVRIVDEDGVTRRAWVSTKALKSGLVAKVAPRKVILANLALEKKA